MHTGQRIAILEGPFADRCDTVGDVHTGQRIAILEGPFADRCDTAGNMYTGQRTATKEVQAADLRDTRYNDYTLDIFRYLIYTVCLLYTSPSPRDRQKSRMPSSA